MNSGARPVLITCPPMPQMIGFAQSRARRLIRQARASSAQREYLGDLMRNRERGVSRVLDERNLQVKPYWDEMRGDMCYLVQTKWAEIVIVN